MNILHDLISLNQVAMLYRRGYDVVEFAKQGAISAVGMELVPEAVSKVMICFSIRFTPGFCQQTSFCVGYSSSRVYIQKQSRANPEGAL